MYVTEVQRGLFNHSYYTKHGYLTVTKNAWVYYMAIAMRSYLWIHVIADLELEDQILQVKYSIPLYTVCYMETPGG